LSNPVNPQPSKYNGKLSATRIGANAGHHPLNLEPNYQMNPLVNDPYNLNRFVAAQEHAYENVCRELERGRKTSHWIWFVFPQLKGLGHSRNSEFYGIASLEEARAYVQHPVLGARLIHCTELVNSVAGRTIEQVLGAIDTLKFRSGMTLFARAAPEIAVFEEALNKHFAGNGDELTLSLLDNGNRHHG
jgi:uncharacterized protein (DUF1810 family)